MAGRRRRQAVQAAAAVTGGRKIAVDHPMAGRQAARRAGAQHRSTECSGAGDGHSRYCGAIRRRRR